jgi:hypothetical protein
MPLIVDWMSIDVNKDFAFGKPRKTGAGSTIIPFQVIDKSTGQYVPLIHQTPQMPLPFGLSAGESSYRMDMSFSGVLQNEDGVYCGEDPVVFKYFEFIRSIDEMIVNSALKQSMDWFKKTLEREKVEDIMCKNTKASTQPTKYSPTFPTKLKTSEGKGSMLLKTEFYDDERNRIEVNNVEEIVAKVPKGSKVVSLLEAPYIWFSRQGFGLSFKVIQCLAIVQSRFDGCAIEYSKFSISGFNYKRPLEDEEKEEVCKIAKF